jgi:hypothetical protein
LCRINKKLWNWHKTTSLAEETCSHQAVLGVVAQSIAVQRTAVLARSLSHTADTVSSKTLLSMFLELLSVFGS